MNEMEKIESMIWQGKQDEKEAEAERAGIAGLKKFEATRRFRETRVLSKTVFAKDAEEAQEIIDADEHKWDETIEDDDLNEMDSNIEEIK